MRNRIVEIASDNVYLSAERGFLKVTNKDEVLGKVALDDIAGLVVRGYGASFSANICSLLAERNAPVIICGKNQNPSSVIWPVAGHHMQGFRMQVQALAKKTLLKKLWSQLVIAKIKNQAFVLRHSGFNDRDLTAMASRIKSGDPENIEAQAARRYWSRLMGKDFRRNRKEKGINAALNYGYTILRAAAARSILAAGLHPSLSVHHKSHGDALRLADDLMEPFRPFIDMTVFEQFRTVEGIEETELDAQFKAKLVAVLSLDLFGSNGSSPLQLCMDRLAQSLAEVFALECSKLELPGQPVPRKCGDQ